MARASHSQHIGACCSTTSPRVRAGHNPPLDWEREKVVTTASDHAIGPEPNLLADSRTACQEDPQSIPLPVLNSDEMAQLKRLDRAKILGGYYKPFRRAEVFIGSLAAARRR
ncbi:MAG: glutamate synthase central domain-containing protein [Bifidobacterium pseudocatenulatum]